MRIYTDLKKYGGGKWPVLTSGSFDGVHLGHKTIIERVNALAKEKNGESVVMTFYPHPRTVLYPNEEKLPQLSSLEEKALLLEKAGVNHLIVCPFTKSFARMSSVNFIKDVIVNQLGVKSLVIGYNHHFGRNREGSFKNLIELSATYGFDLTEIPSHEVDDVSISSTKIRNALIVGDLDTANHFLGYPYFFSGEVVKGDQIGRTIGFPTANLKVNNNSKLIPAAGVYIVKVTIGHIHYPGMMNLGGRPTLGIAEPSIEVHLLNFDQDIYGRVITVALLKKIRNQVTYPSLKALKKQLIEDKLTTQQFFTKPVQPYRTN